MNAQTPNDQTAPTMRQAGPTAPAESRGVVVPRPERRGWLPAIVAGLVSLLQGMAVTFRYLVRPSTVVTEQYPENRATLRLAERARTMLSFIYEENGQHRCTACRTCEKACPNRSIFVVSRKGPVSGRNEIDHFVWRLDSCTFCNMCVLVCPFNALTMSGSFEAAVYDRRLLVYDLNRYAGPTASALAKVATEEERRSMMEPRTPYGGPVPLNGVPFAGIPNPLTPGAEPKKEGAA
jgi:NADH-quinone oxidoreductase subunit I